MEMISQSAFDKKVDTAAAYMEYIDRMKPSESRAAALAEVSQNYTVAN